MKVLVVIIMMLGSVLTLTSAFSNLGFRTPSSCRRKINEPTMMMDVLSITAGSVAGAVGVGFAYPLDSMKTKIQNIAASQSSEGSEKHPLDLFLVAQNILKDEGIWSLYKGVAGVMIGNALIKACAFSANRWALSEFTTGSPTLDQLCMSAAFAGMVTSFFSNPIERVKVLMQSKAKIATGGDFSELEIISQVLKSDGVHGLAFRGLDATLAREIPGYSLYFVGYFTLMHGPLGEGLGPAGPVVIGALAGMLSWLIVFPLDVCKTNLQNTIETVPAVDSWSGSSMTGTKAAESPKNLNLFSTALMLRERHGMGIFVQGMTPKMMQAGVNHSITFFIYDLIVNTFSP